MGLIGAWCGVAGWGWEQMVPMLECRILLVVLRRGMVWAGLSRTGAVRWGGERLADMLEWWRCGAVRWGGWRRWGGERMDAMSEGGSIVVGWVELCCAGPHPRPHRFCFVAACRLCCCCCHCCRCLRRLCRCIHQECGYTNPSLPSLPWKAPPPMGPPPASVTMLLPPAPLLLPPPPARPSAFPPRAAEGGRGPY